MKTEDPVKPRKGVASYRMVLWYAHYKNKIKKIKSTPAHLKTSC